MKKEAKQKEKNETKDKNQEKISRKNTRKKSEVREVLNMKTLFRVVLLLLLMTAISVVSFIGLSVIKDGKAKNIIREYTFANDFDKYYEFVITPNRSAREENVFIDKEGKIVRPVPDNEIYDENKVELKEKKIDLEKIKRESGDEKVKDYKVEKKAYRYNSADVLNEKNYIETRNKIKAILADQKISSYNIREDLESGKFVFEIPQNHVKDVNAIIRMLTQSGKFEIVDTLTGEPYITNSDLKDVKMYNHEQVGMVMQLVLTENGKQKFKDVTTRYAEKTNKLKEEAKKKAENKEETQENKIKQEFQTKVEGIPEIAIKVSGETLQRGEITKPIENGIIQIPFGGIDPSSEDYEKYLSEVATLYSSLKAGEKPILYDIESQKVVEGNANMQKTQNILIIIAGIFAVMAISLIIFFGVKGLLSAFSLITYLALMLIVVRYTNILITVSVIVGMIILYIMQFIFLVMLNSDIKKYGKVDMFKIYIKEYKELIVVLISSIILSSSVHTELASFGRIVFLGIIISLVYNYFITRNLIRD